MDRAGNGGQGTYETRGYVYADSNHAHYLTGIKDPRHDEVLIAANVYHNGRLAGLTQAGDTPGTISFEHDLAGRQEIITDAFGQRTVHEYDARGNVVRSTDPLGQTITRAYDDLDNQRSQTDGLGHKTTFDYDSHGNRTRIEDPLGHVTTFAFNAFDQILTSTDARRNAIDPTRPTTRNTYDKQSGSLLFTTNALGQITSFTYDRHNRLTSTIDALGNQTVYAYYGAGEVEGQNGDLKSVTCRSSQLAILNHASYTYDANGNRRTETTHRQVNGQDEAITTTYFYDGQNRLIETRDALYDSALPTLHCTKTFYNAIGKPETTIDKLGRQTTYTYDVRGNLIQTAYPTELATPLTVSRTVYDAQNRVAYTQDRAEPSDTADPLSPTVSPANRTIYDLAGRVVRVERWARVTILVEADVASGFPATVAVGGTLLSASTTVYDDAGRVTGFTDARGDTTHYGYDEAGRRTNLTNALGQVARFTYDQNGNQTAVTDGLGRTTDYEYDELNRQVRITHPPVHGMNGPRYAQLSAYDALGRRVAETNQDGVMNRYAYDALGRLSAVTNAAGTLDERITRYEYDEAGNLLKRIDANQTLKPIAQQKHTLFTYDKLDRRIKRVLPEAQGESFFYDAVGNLIIHTNFDGRITDFRYDALNRLLKKFDRRRGAADPWVTWQYTAGGQRKTMADASGLTRYVYDLQNRLHIKSTPQGDLTYSYDANGNLLQLGTFLAYGFDAQGNINSSWQRPDGLALAYEWDPLSRLAAVTYNQLPPDANITTYAYDAVGNLTAIPTPTGYGTASATTC